MLRRILGALLLAALVLFAQAAEARRIALVMGIGRYTSLKPLANPLSDATAIAALLRANDFEVFAYNDLTRADMLDALDAFKSEAERADVAFIYYAGHGMENLGKNIIAPVDMEFSCEPKETRRTVELDKLFEAIQNVPQQVVLIDACRNDPFPQCTRGTGSGVGFRGIEVAARGGSRVLVASSTLSGRLAADGPQGGHSPFATALLARFNSDQKTPLRSLLDDVARDVALGSGGAQTPEVTTRGGAPDVCLAASNCAGSSATGPTPQIPAPPPAPRSNCSADLDYQDALRKNTAESYREFLARCPNDRRKETVLGLYARLADEEMWRNVLKENTLSGYIQYQVAFPTGTYIEQARQKQNELQGLNRPVANITPAPLAPNPPTGAVANVAVPNPSFDCALSNTLVEHAICRDAGLADKDRTMDGLYRKLTSTLASDQTTALRIAQRQWLAQRDDCGVSGDPRHCIDALYSSRIGQLQRIAGGGATYSVASAPSSAPGWCSTGALNTVEQAICRDPSLAVKDHVMDGLYNTARSILTGDTLRAVVARQRGWLAIRNECSDPGLATCVARLYDQRIGELQAAVR